MKFIPFILLFIVSQKTSFSQSESLFCLTINDMLSDSSILAKKKAFSNKTNESRFFFVLPHRVKKCEFKSEQIVSDTYENICNLIENNNSLFVIYLTAEDGGKSSNDTVIRATFYQIKKKAKNCKKVILLNSNSLFDERDYNYHFEYDSELKEWILKSKT